jgi:dihydropteroate synthase
MAEVIAGSGCACCIMHNRKYTEYNNLLNDMLDDLKNSIEIAKAAGINEKKIIIDPGIGFAKTQNMNLQVMRNLDVFMTLGFPILLGASRKSMIGITLGLPADKRVEGTVVTTVFGVQKGCSFIRVHDIAENKRAILMTKAIMNSNIQR